jgi:hypothetical protein
MLPRRLRFDRSSDYVDIVVDEKALGQVFYEYFGFPAEFSFH